MEPDETLAAFTDQPWTSDEELLNAAGTWRCEAAVGDPARSARLRGRRNVTGRESRTPQNR